MVSTKPMCEYYGCEWQYDPAETVALPHRYQSLGYIVERCKWCKGTQVVMVR